MKIFFFGNINNYPFILAKELKKKGHEVIFFVDSDTLLYRPENRYEKYREVYPSWIVDISFLRNSKLLKRFNEFNKIIYKYGSPDLVILNGSVCDYLTNIKSHKFFLATGSDIEEECSYLTAIKLFRKNLKRSFFIALFSLFRKIILVKRQRSIFKNCDGFSFFDKNIFEKSEKIFNSLNKLPKRFNFRLADISDKTYSRIEPKKYGKLKTIKIVCLARINWVTEYDKSSYQSHLDNKYIDILIRGIAKFINEYNGSAELTLFKKGNKIDETKELINKLNIENEVVWRNEVDQIELAKYYEYADLIADQFNPNAVMGTAALNAMLASRPILANNKIDSCIINNRFKNPNINISKPRDLANYLKQIQDNPKILEIIAKKGKTFIEKNHSPELIADILLDNFR